MMQIATWNVNSLKVRLPQVIDWLQQSNCDVLCLQELKMETHKFPLDTFQDLGFHCAYTGQKTYNGVAIISRYPIHDIVLNNPHFEDPQQRLVSATLDTPLGAVRVICAYCPNGSEVGSEKYHYKLQWFEALQIWIKAQQACFEHVVLTGDFNIAPEDQDVHDKYQGELLISPAERSAFQALLGLGLCDAFRLFEQAPKSYSWWDYRMMGFRRNAGLRIDHILISSSLQKYCQSCEIDKAPRANEQPSDHTPVIARFQT